MKIAIIGAGFGGMSAAFDLRNAGHAVTIFDSADFVGGPVDSKSRAGTGRWKSFITTGSKATRPCSA
jgi:uncharacterized protein with NAD-binding domain and iron-sulfur cluster